MTDITNQKKDPLPFAIARSLSAADGYMDLTMWAQAEEELNSVPPPYSDTLPFLDLQYRLLAGKEQWLQATTIAQQIHERRPDEIASWVILAYATRRSQTIQAAKTILLQAIPRFPDAAILPYNLACYECRMEQMDQAKKYLETAFKLDNAYRKLAMTDDDLKPFWPMFDLNADIESE